MNKISLLALAVAWTGCATLAPDRDAEARISYAEFARALRAEGFAKTDKNRDGLISWEEWQQLDTSPEAKAHFDALDADRSGTVSADEWRAGLEKTGVSIKLFKQLDSDRDGSLGAGEWGRMPVGGILQIQF
ncbi:MAG: hypothetical protein N3B01_04845 [Verrucomicrobiae bacterium]|nr:hypothetical protein [Verrucomicrobiae bacterium]